MAHTLAGEDSHMVVAVDHIAVQIGPWNFPGVSHSLGGL